MKTCFTLLLGASVLIGGAASAQTICEQCGTLPPPPPPPVTCSVKGNAGVGNGGEQLSNVEYQDCDPGKSGLHNQAWKNIDKPRSQFVR